MAYLPSRNGTFYLNPSKSVETFKSKVELMYKYSFLTTDPRYNLQYCIEYWKIIK